MASGIKSRPIQLIRSGNFPLEHPALSEVGGPTRSRNHVVVKPYGPEKRFVRQVRWPARGRAISDLDLQHVIRSWIIARSSPALMLHKPGGGSERIEHSQAPVPMIVSSKPDVGILAPVDLSSEDVGGVSGS